MLNIPISGGNSVRGLLPARRSTAGGGAIEEAGPVDPKDLVGILRTLLHSIEAHAWHRGPERGYVSFLQEFMAGGGLY